ncbi:SGNH/GDSL hydrolase family protein [Trichothermofontia sp.]
MFRRSSPYRSQYRRQQRPRWFWPTIVLLGIPLTLITLELLMRLTALVLGDSHAIRAYEGEPERVTAYRLQFVGDRNQPIDGLRNQGQLQAQRSVLRGYRLLPDQQTAFWQINDQGFRDEATLPLQKPQGEIRIFVVGGSTAFGSLSSSNDTTFAARLETRLNERIAAQTQHPERFRPEVLPYFKDEVDRALARPPRLREGIYRVINAAVPGYTSGNELVQVAQQVLQYSPDLVIVLNGYPDLLLRSDAEATDVPMASEFLNHATSHFSHHLRQQVSELVANTYLVKGLHYWFLRSPQLGASTSLLTIDAASLTQQLPKDEAERNQRGDRYQNNLRQIARLTTAIQKPLIIALQPEITGRGESPHPSEMALLKDLSPAYRQAIAAGYQTLDAQTKALKQEFPNRLTVLNLYKLYADFPEQAFYSPVHLTDAGHARLADRLYDAAVPWFFVQPRNNTQP